jgi:ABC-type dipeptide/oligopeptide/nickel transport system permease subunit
MRPFWTRKTASLRNLALAILLSVFLCGVFAPQLAPFSYDRQFRDSPNAPPGGSFPMGTDDIGRDRLSRLLYGTRVSLLLAPAAALVSILIALLLSLLASRFALPGHAISGLTTLCLSLPWLFLFIVLRAALPLNTAPLTSALLTFGLMGVAGWAWPARVFTASIREIARSGWILQARAAGLPGWRIALVHGWPHLRLIAVAQFRVLVPACILAEASLGLLGLGVADPLPSWGNLLQDLQHPDTVRSNPWVLAPLGLLILVMVCLESLQPATPRSSLQLPEKATL